jgi:uncharacterized integral membrane protein
MYLTLIIAFLLVFVISITGIQNSIPLELKFFVWKLDMSLTALIFYYSVVGAVIVAVLTLPNIWRKYFRIRNLSKEIDRLEKRIMFLESQNLKKIEEKQSPGEKHI